ncbi:hypothetical protein [Roseibium polysiphoniae]|uniref:hypothetical protein n=1 Tax=Roseibium polysiphoniae TaxID=2571221 RepID=UPI0030844E45
MKWVLAAGVLALAFSSELAGQAFAGKGDRVVSVQRRSPLLERKVLDLRFADFAQGIWTTDQEACSDLRSIDRSQPGSTVAIFRGLMETPDRICTVYGAEQGALEAQRAAMNCDLVAGGDALGLLTVRRRGSQGLMVQDGERPPEYFRFCRGIVPVTQSASQ